MTPPVDDNVTFSLEIEQGATVRLWIDDHLHLDSTLQGQGATQYNATYSAPLLANVAFPIRIEYQHLSASTPVLKLSWSGSHIAPGIVPSAVLKPDIRPTDDKRWELRDRLMYSPVVWQTSWIGDAATHVHVQSGLALGLSIADVDEEEIMPGIHVYTHSDPAIVRLGPHSYNGSLYTQVNVSAWKKRACDVSIETTVVNNGLDLLALVTANGSDCTNMAIVLEPEMLWNRAGWFNLSSDWTYINATRPGFYDIRAFVSGDPFSFPLGGDTYLAQSLAPAAPNGTSAVGFSTGRAYSVAEIQAAVQQARAAQAATSQSYPPDLRDVYEGVQSIIAWNTLYSPIEGHYSPVSRGWQWGGENALLFDWDIYFVAYMAGLENGTSRDIAFQNMIAITLARTYQGMVPNWANGLSGSPDRSEPQIGAYVLQQLVHKWGGEAQWLVELLFPPLLAWHNWTYTRRRAEGSLAPSPDELTDLYCLGSDWPLSNVPGGDSASGTLGGSRLESGQDNGPEFEGIDCVPPGPVTFNNATSHMELYSVLQTGLFLSDTAALIALAPLAGAQAMVPLLQARFNATAGALVQFCAP